jgi:RNA polymerase sigma-70 factor (ECF subfamily)
MIQKDKMESAYPMTATDRADSPDPDLALVERIQKGDSTALDELITKYQKWVYTLAYRTVRNHADADDVAQETFIRVYRHIGQFQPKTGHQFAGWLYRITVNQSLNQAKKKSRENAGRVSFSPSNQDEEKLDPVNTIPDPKPQPDTLVLNQELKSKIDEILDSLSPEHRATFTLCELQGYSYKEIAEIMQCPIGTVMSRLHYTKKILKERLKSYL